MYMIYGNGSQDKYNRVMKECKRETRRKTHRPFLTGRSFLKIAYNPCKNIWIKMLEDIYLIVPQKREIVIKTLSEIYIKNDDLSAIQMSIRISNVHLY